MGYGVTGEEPADDDDGDDVTTMMAIIMVIAVMVCTYVGYVRTHVVAMAMKLTTTAISAMMIV